MNCLICKTELQEKNIFKAQKCNNFFICSYCLDIFIFPRLLNTVFVDSRFNPLEEEQVPSKSYCIDDNDILYWNITKSILKDKCISCNESDCLVFTNCNSTFKKNEKKENESNKSIMIKKTRKRAISIHDSNFYRQYECILKLQEIYKIMFVEYNSKKTPFYIQMDKDKNYVLQSGNSVYLKPFKTKTKINSIQDSNECIIENVILKHSIYTGNDMLFFIHEAKLLQLNKILEMIETSTIFGPCIQEKKVEKITHCIYKMLQEHYFNELRKKCLDITCDFCDTFHNLSQKDFSVQTRRNYCIDQLKRNNYEFPCFACKMKIGLINVDNNPKLKILYDNFFSKLAVEEIQNFYFHHPVYENCQDLFYDTRIAFWQILQRLDFFYHEIWKRHAHQSQNFIFFEMKKEKEKEKEKKKKNNFLSVIFSNPSKLTFFEWILLGCISDTIDIFFKEEKIEETDREIEEGEIETNKSGIDSDTSDKTKRTRARTVIMSFQKQCTFQFYIKNTDNSHLHSPNEKISILDVHNLFHFSSFQAFIHTI